MVTGDNPFIRFKNHIDNNVRRGLDLLFGSPPSISAATSSPDLVSLHDDDGSVNRSKNEASFPPLQQHQQRLQPSSSLPSSSRLKMADRRASTTAATAEESEQQQQTTTTTIDEVHIWSIQSPYSPLNLQHLPQPIPRGAPRTCEAHFTFRDAFEDLLVAGSGQPLPSMRELAWKKRREALPFWEDRRGLHVTQWVGRLAALGLWDAYFQMEPGATGRMRRRGEKDVERQLYFREGGGGGPASWGVRRDRDGAGGVWDDHRARRAADADRSSFDAKGVWDAVWKVALDREGDGEADVEDELYGTSTTSSSPPANKALVERDSKNGRGVVEWQEGSGSRKPSAPEVTTTVYADGSKYVKTTERLECDGKTKVTTTAQRFDPAGNLTSESRETSTSTTRTWSGGIPGVEASFSWSWNNDTGTQKRDSDDSGREDRDAADDQEAGWKGRKEEKKGWFWNR
ncbi:hypothetical protein F4782DRAFT_315903 [Xylaria castorea]|nr:hypothetical protein F4782DRAFT_315903 [Xylaria castorea]